MTYSTHLPGPHGVSSGYAHARLAPEIAALFPRGVVAAALEGEADPGLLLGEERGAVAGVAHKRFKDYTAGRVCARAALREIGVHNFALLPGASRQPLWPDTVTGSITHTDGYCIAVAARRACASSLGIDCEVVAAVHEELWPRICRPEELAWLARQPPARRQPLAALVFAAKESFYKSQYPLTAEWLGFEDAVVELAGEGHLRMRPCRPFRLAGHTALPLTGAYRFHGAWVTAAFAIPPGAPARSAPP